MVLMSSADSSFIAEDRQALLNVARQSVTAGVSGEKYKPKSAEFSSALQDVGASFVTLKIESKLRGCIGTLEAHQPLVVDVASNAYSAAFRDSRFPGLQSSELEMLEFHLSILSKPEPMQVESEEDLLAQMRPHIDGLVIEEGHRRGTFLPAVWESLPDAKEFLKHLKQKAGLPIDYWSDEIKVSRYTSESIS